MRNKLSIKRWPSFLMVLVLLIALLGISSSVVSAQPPPASPPAATMELPNGSFPGTMNDYIDITIGSDKLLGWCSESNYHIWVPGTYQIHTYDFFGDYYPDYVTAPFLPDRVLAVNWYAIAYILNNKQGDATDIQSAIWYFTDADSYPVTPIGWIMVNEAEAYLAANGGVFVPGSLQIKPIICVPDNGCQILFYDYVIPGTPPVPELPAGVLLGFGLVGLAGFGWIGYRKSCVAAV